LGYSIGTGVLNQYRVTVLLLVMKHDIEILFFRTFSVQEVVAMLDDSGKGINQIFIEPPEAAILTDEDSADEDNGGLIDNLSDRQLRAGAQVVFADRSRDDVTDEQSSEQSSDNDDNDDWCEKDDEEADMEHSVENASRSQPARKRRPVRNVTAKGSAKHPKTGPAVWTQDDFTTSQLAFPGADYSGIRSLSPVELFELFFTDDVWQMMISECTRYAFFPQLCRSKSNC